MVCQFTAYNDLRASLSKLKCYKAAECPSAHWARDKSVLTILR